MDQIINHAVLSLDFWQDTVTYEGCTMPAGTIGCEVLNIPDITIENLDTPCNVLNQLLQGMNTGSWIWSCCRRCSRPLARSSPFAATPRSPPESELF